MVASEHGPLSARPDAELSNNLDPPELGIMERLMPRVQRGRYVLIPTSEQTHGHGTHTWPAVWGSELAKFLRVVESYRENHH